MRAAADAREVLELLEHEAADAAPLVVGVHGELLDEERAHVALLEVALVHPVVGAGDLEGALGVADDRRRFSAVTSKRSCSTPSSS